MKIVTHIILLQPGGYIEQSIKKIKNSYTEKMQDV